VWFHFIFSEPLPPIERRLTEEEDGMLCSLVTIKEIEDALRSLANHKAPLTASLLLFSSNTGQ